MIFKRPSNTIYTESQCQKLVRAVAFFVFALFMSFSTPGQASLAEQCSELFQSETKLPSLPFLLNRSDDSLVHQENLNSLQEVAIELSQRLNAKALTGAKDKEARHLISLIKKFDANSAQAPKLIFEIMARYSILISHGYVANVKEESTWFEDLLSRGRKRSSLRGNLNEIQRLMEDKNFGEFRDLTLVGLLDIYKSINKGPEKPAIIYSFKDLGISEFILNSDSGYFFVGLSKTNGLSFDNNKNYTALTFFQHDTLHIELSQMWRIISDKDHEKEDLPNMTKRAQDLFTIRKLYSNLDKHFSPFEKRFLRASLFIALHEYGFTPYQFIRRVKTNPAESAQFIYTYLIQMEVLMRPLKEDMAVLEKNPEKMKVLSKILTKFISLTEARP